MANKTANVKIPVEPQRRERWNEAADELPNVSSTAGMVRLAVEQFLSEDAGGDGAGEEVSQALSEVLEQNRELRTTLDAVEARLNSVEQAVNEDPDIAALKSEVFAVLPTEEEIEEYDDPASGAVPNRLPEDQGGPKAYSGEVAAVAALTDSSELQVQKALDQLVSDTARVREDGGRYWKVV